MKEVFKDIEGYHNDYQVSNLGNVKSLKNFKQRLLKPQDDGKGYLMVRLCYKGKMKNHKVHKLVAMAFLNHKPCGMKLVVDHINNNKTDNRAENLQIITNRKNTIKDFEKRKSKLIGARFEKRNNNWTSRILINGKTKHLGTFKTELEASQAYQSALNKI